MFKVSETVKVLDEEGKEVRPGEIGEVTVAREHQGSSGYYGDEQKSARTYRKVGGKTCIFTVEALPDLIGAPLSDNEALAV